MQQAERATRFQSVTGYWMAAALLIGVTAAPVSAATEVVFQTNEQVHVGDERISSWSDLYGSCVTLRLPDVRQGDQISFSYRPYGVEHATVNFMGVSRAMAPQIPRSGKKRPNYWGQLGRVDFIAPRDGRSPMIELCAQNVAPRGQRIDLDDFMVMDLRVERRAAAQSVAPKPVAPQPAAPKPATRGAVFEAVTQTNWTLSSSPKSCGIGSTPTEYQRFLPSEYYNVIGGRENHANDGKTAYFNVDEAAQSFEARYLTFTKFTRSPWNISTYFGQLNSDGSMRVVHEFQQIDTKTMNSSRPSYSFDRKEHVLWPCDNLPEMTASTSGASRVLISVPQTQMGDRLARCDVLFDASFASIDSPLITTFEKVNGRWQGRNSHSGKCESTMPGLCPSFNGDWVNVPQEISADPLVLQVKDSKCQSDYQFDFDGHKARVDVTHNASCTMEPFSFYMMECQG